jgi:transcriptional regulator with XRE-family HTH domain
MGTPMSNTEFGDRIGVTHSMASRIRSGQRLPSRKVALAMHREFGWPLELILDTAEEGPEEFGKFIRTKLEVEARAAAA